MAHLHELIEHVKAHVERCHELCKEPTGQKDAIAGHVVEIDAKIHEIEDHIRRLLSGK